MVGFAKDLDGYLRNHGVSCGWEEFRRNLHQRAADAGIETSNLTIVHPIFTRLLNEMRAGPLGPGVDITGNYHR